MPAKTTYKVLINNSVAAGATVFTESAIPPGGQKLFIKSFGYCDPLVNGTGGLVVLQWGNGSSWETLRVGSSGSNEYLLYRLLTTDGVNRLRLVRINNSSAAKLMAGWLDATLDDG